MRLAWCILRIFRLPGPRGSDEIRALIGQSRWRPVPVSLGSPGFRGARRSVSSVDVPGYRLNSGNSSGIPRILEAAVAALALVVSAPFVLLAIVAIRLTSRGPAFFRQSRVGRRGEIFQLHKLRTMRTAAGPEGLKVTAQDDVRITPVGRILRLTKIDEIPELWNVVRGEMSLVGPRPEVPRFVDLGNPLWRRVLKVRPGLTDPVTLRLRNEEALLATVAGNREAFYRDVLQPYKLRGYAQYLDRRTAWTDIQVLGKTLLTVIRPATAPPPSLAELTRPAAEPDAQESESPTSSGGLNLRHVQYLLDVLVLAVAYGLSYLLRFDFDVRRPDMAYLLPQLPWVLSIQSGALFAAGVHRFIWRYVGIREARRFLDAAVWSGGALILMRLAPLSLFASRIPLSIIIMDTVLGFGGVLAMRVVRRITYERGRREIASESSSVTRRRVLLLGAGQAGVLAAREILGRGDLDIDIQGFVDDDPRKQGALIHGIPVLGATRDLRRLVAEAKIQDVVITIAQISRREILRMIEMCRTIGVNVRIIPGLYEILQGKVRVTRIRSVDDRGPARARAGLPRRRRDRPFRRRKSRDGHGRRRIDRLRARPPGRAVRPLVSAARRARGVRALRHRQGAAPALPAAADRAVVADVARRALDPDGVLDALSAGRLPRGGAQARADDGERIPREAIKNNIFGTRVSRRARRRIPASKRSCMISTDKAVRPTSVMGASKRVAEIVIQDLARRSKTRFVAVRFGNVIGSAGSVIPIFREQIQRGGPVTVTHPEMKRYFMTIPEAAQLVMQAGAMGQGGEIFILDMGEPVRILDLAGR